MNLEDYFQRIGFSGPSDKADLETLKNIHRQHVLSIPFENLSIHCGEWISMDLESIYTKIVKNHRGGWCCENNLLFAWVLKEMGYTYTTLGARVFNGLENDFGLRESHLLNKVLVNGNAYIADVSFGVHGQMHHPIELVSGKGQTQPPGVFRLLEKSGAWVLEKTGRKPVVPNENFADSILAKAVTTKQLYSFTLTPRSVEDFQETSKFLQTSPESLFTNKSICSLQTLTGYKALIGWTYCEVTYNYQDGVDLLDMKAIANDEIDKVLEDEFSLVLKNKHTPKDEKANFTI